MGMLRARESWPIRGLPPLLLTAVALTVLPASAGAGTVSAKQSAGENGGGLQTRVDFEAAPGETNLLRVSVAARLGDAYLLEVLDSGSPLSAGEGCSGGGTAGTPASCLVEIPREPVYEYCGRDCIHRPPQTSWTGLLHFDLGDGDDSLDAGSLPAGGKPVVLPAGGPEIPFELNVEGGPGDDRIITGPGDDVIHPGSGDDEVHAGDGGDSVDPGPVPDGPDLYDLGPNTGLHKDKVSYAARPTPVDLQGGVAGAPGEGDVLEGVEEVIGGSGDDSLSGGSGVEDLAGGPGDDVLVADGSQQRYKPILEGGEGNDRLYGDAHEDLLIGERRRLHARRRRR